ASARHLRNHILETQCGLLELLEGSHATFFLLPKTSQELLFLFSILADRVLDLGKDPSLLAQFFLLMRQFCFDILLIGHLVVQFLNQISIEENCRFQIMLALKQYSKRNFTAKKNKGTATTVPAIKRNGPSPQKRASLIQGYSESLRFGLFLLHCTEDRSKLRVCRIQVLGFPFQISVDLAKRLEN